jgi:hypothetical protein
MRTIFDPATRNELISRINNLTKQSTAQWGKMDVYQMLLHCSLWEEFNLGKKKYKQAFIGRIFGKMALKKMLKDDSPAGRGLPTVSDFKTTGVSGDVEAQKNKWIALINEHNDIHDYEIVHPFFGKMTKEQVGFMAYKHTDHHLRQFNV